MLVSIILGPWHRERTLCGMLACNQRGKRQHVSRKFLLHLSETAECMAFKKVSKRLSKGEGDVPLPKLTTMRRL